MQTASANRLIATDTNENAYARLVLINSISSMSALRALFIVPGILSLLKSLPYFRAVDILATLGILVLVRFRIEYCKCHCDTKEIRGHSN